jgi:N,N'-diacetyllegionaminate synthase
MKYVKIKNSKIGRGLPPYVVAEAGINHNGELEKALKMIRIAKKCGVNAIKFQTFRAKEFIAKEDQLFSYQSQGKQITESMLKMFERYEFDKKEWQKIKKSCDENKITFLSTPQNESDLNLLLDIGIPAIKVGADDLINSYLLKQYSKTKLPLILSTGMSTLTEIIHALNSVHAFDGYPIILLQTTSEYPTPPKNVNLNKILSLMQYFPTLPIGFSDHTQGSLASSLAVSMGSCFFEKHFTLDHNLSGPDHWFSEDIIGLKKWVFEIKESYKMMGKGVLMPTKQELLNKQEFQRRIVALKNIKKDTKFSVKNIGMMRIRGGKGLTPELFELILNKNSSRNYKKGESIEI